MGRSLEFDLPEPEARIDVLVATGLEDSELSVVGFHERPIAQQPAEAAGLGGSGDRDEPIHGAVGSEEPGQVAHGGGRGSRRGTGIGQLGEQLVESVDERVDEPRAAGIGDPFVGPVEGAGGAIEDRLQVFDQPEVDPSVDEPDVVGVDRPGGVGRRLGQGGAFAGDDLYGSDVVPDERDEPSGKRPETAHLGPGVVEPGSGRVERGRRPGLVTVGRQVESVVDRMDPVGHVADRQGRREREEGTREGGAGSPDRDAGGDRAPPAVRHQPYPGEGHGRRRDEPRRASWHRGTGRRRDRPAPAQAAPRPPRRAPGGALVAPRRAR